VTEITKAIAFAAHCLKWADASVANAEGDIIIIGKRGGIADSFNPDSMWQLQEVLQEFLGNSYYIQINRGTSNLFHWRVIVGWQNGSDKSKNTEQAVGVGEDTWDAIFDACVAAAHMGGQAI
jgi:hypothetical protein